MASSPSANPPLGVWNQACQDYDGDFVGTSILIEKKSKLTWRQAQTAFEEESCATAYLKFEKHYEAGISAAGDVDLVMKDMTYTPLTAEVTEALNEAEFCGLKNWQVGKSQTIINKDCEEISILASLKNLYTIFKVQNDQLYVGQADEKFDGSSPSKRHLRFQSSAFTKGPR